MKIMRNNGVLEEMTNEEQKIYDKLYKESLKHSKDKSQKKEEPIFNANISNKNKEEKERINRTILFQMEMQRKWNEEHREQEKFLKENSNKLNKALCELIKKENNKDCEKHKNENVEILKYKYPERYKLLTTIKENPKASRKQIAKFLSISISTLDKQFQNICEFLKRPVDEQKGIETIREIVRNLNI